MLSYVQLFVTPWTIKPSRPLCLWNFPGKKMGVGCHFLLQGFIHAYTSRTEKAMAPHSSTLACKIPWTEEPGRLQSMRLLRVRHD